MKKPSTVNWHIPLVGSPSASLPVKRDLTLAYRVSLIIAVLMTVASVLASCSDPPGATAIWLVLIARRRFQLRRYERNRLP